MYLKVLILGGYGGAGKALVECLLPFPFEQILIGGRNLEKAQAFKSALLQKYPNANIDIRPVDAADKESLLTSLADIDLVVNCATIPDHISTLTEAALAADVDVIDILVRSDLIRKYEKYEAAIKASDRRFIIQAGFHPGIISPIVRLVKDHFDSYQEADLFMAMDPIFEQAESIKEILYEVIKTRSTILKDGKWRKASYRDTKSAVFSEYFGEKNCYPLQMSELHGLEEELGLQNMGVYAAGFDPYIDNFIFTLTLVLGWLSPRLSANICSKLFYKHIKNRPEKVPRVELILEATGWKAGKKKKVQLKLDAEDGYWLTAISVAAFIKQYLAQQITSPGLYLMGKITDETQLFTDLQDMGLQYQIETV